jgi:adenylate cyclase
MEDPGATLGRRASRDGDAPGSWWRNYAIAGLIAALLIPFVFAPSFRLVEARLFDILSTLAPPRPPQPGVTVVAIDEPSFGEIG